MGEKPTRKEMIDALKDALDLAEFCSDEFDCADDCDPLCMGAELCGLHPCNEIGCVIWKRDTIRAVLDRAKGESS